MELDDLLVHTGGINCGAFLVDALVIRLYAFEPSPTYRIDSEAKNICTVRLEALQLGACP